jgi:hypothetical protein
MENKTKHPRTRTVKYQQRSQQVLRKKGIKGRRKNGVS